MFKSRGFSSDDDALLMEAIGFGPHVWSQACELPSLVRETCAC